jgi:hypothetical protein
VEKDSNKAWHDYHIKTNYFSKGDLLLSYDNEYEESQEAPNALDGTIINCKNQILRCNLISLAG